MWRYLCVAYFLFLLNQFGLVDNSGIRIPLYRQKSPRENAMNSKNMEHHGVFLSWLRKPSKHHHKNATNGTDAVALYRFLDNEFYGKVLIGQTGQTVNMVFDTAWQQSWVLSADCDWKTIGCWFHNKYDHTRSFTYKADGRKYVAPEGSYNLTGYYSNDTFSIAHLRANNQSFVEMVSVPYTYLFTKADGVMGLGIRTGDYEPFFYNLLRNRTLMKKPLFSIYLNRDRRSSKGGNILLGFIDPKHIHQMPNPDDKKKPLPMPITYLPVDSTYGYWGFHMDRVVLDMTSKNKTYPFCVSGCTAISDSSNTLIMGPSQDVAKIHTLIKAKYLSFGRYRVKCDDVKNLPPIEFVLAGKNFTLKGEHYTQQMSLGAVTLCLSAFVEMTVPSLNDYWVLGGAFLAQFYSIYDLENKQIGFVLAA